MLAVDAPSERLTRTLLAIIVALHLALAFWYGTNTPYRSPGRLFINGKVPIADVGAPDERQHANYVARLVEGRGFGVFDPKAPDFDDEYENHQPPVYYVAAAGYAKLVGLDANAIRSPEGRSLRWISLVFGGLGVLGAYALGRWGYGRRDVGLLAAAFFAFLPMNVALSGAVSNDPPLIALFVWTIALATLGVREGWTIRLGLACGILTALAILTKTTGLALLPILLTAAWLRRPNLRQSAAVLVPALLLPLPWILRNQALYHEPFALKAFQSAFSHTAQASTFVDDPRVGLVGYLVNWLGWWTARSFFGAFGYMDIWLNETGSPYTGPNTLYRILLALLVVAFAAWVVRFREAEGAERKLHGLGIVSTVIVSLLFLRFGLQYFQAQARYLFPALGPIAVGVAWGSLRLAKGNWKVAFASVAVPLLAVALLAGTILPSEFAKRL